MSLKLGHDRVGVRPKSGSQSLPPIFRRTEKFFQLFLFLRIVSALRRLNLDLRLEHYALDCFCFRRVGDFQNEMQQWGEPALGRFNPSYFEIEIRHSLSGAKRS